MIGHSSKVLIKYVQEVSLLCDIEQKLIVLNVIIFYRLIGIKVFRDFIDAILQSTERLVTHLTQVKRVYISLL